jgi:hypothetical protein
MIAFSFTGLRDADMLLRLNGQLSSWGVTHICYVDEREYDLWCSLYPNLTTRMRAKHDGNPFGGEGFRKKLYCMRDMANDIKDGDTWINIDSDVMFKNKSILLNFKCDKNQIKGSGDLNKTIFDGISFHHISGAVQSLGYNLFNKIINMSTDEVEHYISKINNTGYCPGDDVMISYLAQDVFKGEFINYRGKLNIDASKVYNNNNADIIW